MYGLNTELWSRVLQQLPRKALGSARLACPLFARLSYALDAAAIITLTPSNCSMNRWIKWHRFVRLREIKLYGCRGRNCHDAGALLNCFGYVIPRDAAALARVTSLRLGMGADTSLDRAVLALVLLRLPGLLAIVMPQGCGVIDSFAEVVMLPQAVPGLRHLDAPDLEAGPATAQQLRKLPLESLTIRWLVNGIGDDDDDPGGSLSDAIAALPCATLTRLDLVGRMVPDMEDGTSQWEPGRLMVPPGGVRMAQLRRLGGVELTPNLVRGGGSGMQGRGGRGEGPMANTRGCGPGPRG
jgi:hypothetical protein